MSDQCAFAFVREPSRARPARPEYVFMCTDAGDAAEAVVRSRERIMREQAIRGSEIPIRRLHISLCGMGNFKRVPSRIPFAGRLAAGKIAMPGFEVVLHRVVTFPSGRPDRRATVLLAKSDMLQQLGDDLFQRLRGIGVRASPLATPHMTLFYSGQSVRPMAIEPIRFKVDRFYLIHSERGLTRYNILGCWALGTGPSVPIQPAPLAFGSMAA